MIEELDGFCVERKVVGVFVVEKVDRVWVELHAEGLEKENIVTHNVLVRKVKLMHDDRIDVIVAQEIICNQE